MKVGSLAACFSVLRHGPEQKIPHETHVLTMVKERLNMHQNLVPILVAKMKIWITKYHWGRIQPVKYLAI